MSSADGLCSYPIREGVPYFLAGEPIESSETAAQLCRLNRLCDEKGWRVAIQEVYGANSNLYRYVTDLSRTAFIELLPLTAQSVVLEIGPGLGQFTAGLAARAAWVYALEVVPGQALFTAKRCAQLGAANVSVACGGDDCRFPYVSNSFDVVVCSLVLEWCASRNEDEWLGQSQERFVREVARVLKPGGCFYLMTKNRFALRLLLGGRDEHAEGMRFGSAQPRWLMIWRLRRRGLRRPRGVLYSHAELARMLRDAGLTELRSFWAMPEMRYPTRFVPAEGHSIREARRQGGLEQGERRLTRLLMPWIPAGLVKYVTPGLTFLARKPL